MNLPPKNKCQFVISHEQNYSLHLNLTSCKRGHRYYIGIIQIFERLRNSCAGVPHDFTHDLSAASS